MASALGWLDHDADAQAKTLDLLARFQQKESRDELGIGTIRDSFAEQLFPGTSTIQTRLRYMLFVPWMYQRLENKCIPAANFGTQADRDERALIIPSPSSKKIRPVHLVKTHAKSLNVCPVPFTGPGYVAGVFARSYGRRKNIIGVLMNFIARARNSMSRNIKKKIVVIWATPACSNQPRAGTPACLYHRQTFLMR